MKFPLGRVRRHAILSCLMVSSPLLSASCQAQGGAAPSGAAQQGAAPAEIGSWVFAPKVDPFSKEALLDLRYLNEKEAGQSGFLKQSTDGNDFVLGSGAPVRFWAVNTTVYRQSDEHLEYHARWLAKMGVNMVRMHGSMSPKAKDSRITDVDQEEIDRCWRLVAAMKKQGIYTTISPFWANGGHAGTKASWGLDGYGDGNDIWGLMFFNDDLRNAYKTWVKELYTRKNPYTGIALKDDPAVGIIQVKNEDSLFFWTSTAIKPQQMDLLRRKYAEWLQKRYGSLEKARAAWDGFGFEGDDFANGRAGIMNVWHMTQAQEGGAAKRVRDEITFFAETQRDFYADIASYYRNELGCKQLINANNWITASTEKLNDVERWTYTATDVMAVNKYYNGGEHTGPNTGWRIDPGDAFENKSALKNPGGLPTNLKQVVGHPMMVTESSWVPPLGYQSEGPFLMAVYQSLTGMDNYYWFSADDPGYSADPFFQWHTFPDGQKGVFKWSLHPGVSANFPAAALLYRQGHVKRGDVVVHEERSLQNMLNRTTPIISEGASFDPNRQAQFAEGSSVKSLVDPLAFLVGRVEVKYGGDPAQSKVADLSKFIDADKKTVTSTTGEVKLDYGAGVCTVNTPKAQGATGFLRPMGAIKLRDLTVQSGNEYATVLAVPMDNQPLNASKRVLVQVGTIVRTTGWQTEPADFKSGDGKETLRGERIVNTGTMPWRVVGTDVTITLRNPNIKSATLLDSSGMAAQTLTGKSTGGAFTVTLPRNAMHVVLQ